MDNVNLTQEIVHNMKIKKGHAGMMVMKLDLYKAYDSLDWNFLERTFRDFGFPNIIVDLFLFMIKKVSSPFSGMERNSHLSNRGVGLGKEIPSLFISSF